MVAASPFQLPVALRFSNVFDIKKRQSELDFVDVLVDTDIPLFLDPFSLKIGEDGWSKECNNLVVGFFQELIDAMRSGNEARAHELLTNLHEPNETRLGLSKGSPAGRGVGRKQAMSLYSAFEKSKAVKTGLLSDLSDCELFIEGISHDKISDVTINIARRKLVQFTQQQCRKWGVKMERRPTGPYWHDGAKEWRSGYDDVPVYNGQPIILVPKEAVRYRMVIDDRDYYDKHVIEYYREEYIQQENVNSGASLTKVLRGGRRVTKKELKVEHPFSKENLRKFSEDHPAVLRKYKKQAEDDVRAGTYKPSDSKIYNIELNVAHLQDLFLIEEVQQMSRNTVHGDNFGAVGQGNQVRIRDITVFKAEVDAAGFDSATAAALKQAIDAIEAEQIKPEDKEDAKENLQKLTDELKQEKRPGVVRRCVQRLAEVVPDLAKIVGGAAAIAEIVSKATS
jgi:hypothetical protein